MSKTPSRLGRYWKKAAEGQASVMRPQGLDPLRIVLEFFLFGWWIPGFRWRRQVRSDAEDHDADGHFDELHDVEE